MNSETKEFISTHLSADVHQLSLQAGRFPLVDMALAIRQINGMQKIKNKVPLFYTTDGILYPAQLSLEQSSSQATATYKSTLCEGNSLTDLTGGFGIDCSFMSAHFKKVSYIERQTELCELASYNFRMLGKNHIEIFNQNTESFLPEMQAVDWIFIDPARRSTGGKKVVLLSDCEPDVSALSALLLEKAANVMIKLSPMMDISAALRDLPQTTEVHIVAVENECKEVLLILRKNNDKPLQVFTVNFGKNDHQQLFKFDAQEESSSTSKLTSELGKYLYEPNAAVMKSGGFKLIGNHFGLSKLHDNTHLYTGNELLLQFPGRIFSVNKVWKNSRLSLKQLSTEHPKANISTRNFPISVDELRKKLKIKDGGETYLFACTLANEEKVIIECKKGE
jgi:16S rRNA G966 N2-methylase RsmD